MLDNTFCFDTYKGTFRYAKYILLGNIPGVYVTESGVDVELACHGCFIGHLHLLQWRTISIGLCLSSLC